MTSTRADALTVLKAATAKQTTALLLTAHADLESRPTLTQEERIVLAAIADVIEERHNLTDAMDAIYADVDYTGTYNAALRAALRAALAQTAHA